MPRTENEFAGDADQFLVRTPFGKGLVVRTRHDVAEKDSKNGSLTCRPVKEVRLLAWENAIKAGKTSSSRFSKPMLYTCADLETVEPKPGDDVLTPYGRGRVVTMVNVRIRRSAANDEAQPSAKKAQQEEASAATQQVYEEDKKEDDPDAMLALAAKQHQPSSLLSSTADDDGSIKERTLIKYQIVLTSWRLAGRSTVKCFLFAGPDVRCVRKKVLGEMNAFERVEFAKRQKKSAQTVFSQKKYQQALNLYAGAVDAVRYVQHDANSSNEVRADLVELMVTCSNNAATCSVQLQKWAEAQKFAQNALVLLDALYSKRGKKIHTILTKGNSGLCDAKLFGEWRAKSHMIIARAMAERDEDEEAIDELKKARELITMFTTGEELELAEKDSVASTSVATLKNQEREVLKLLAKCIEHKKATLKLEKARAQAMFGGGGGDSVKASNGHSQSAHLSCNNNNGPSSLASAPFGKKAVVAPDSSRPTLHKKDDDISNGEVETPSIKPRVVGSLPKPFSTTKSLTQVPKKVSFAERLEETQGVQESSLAAADDDEEEHEAWYTEHKEAFVMVVGIALMVSFCVWHGKKK